MSKKGQVSQGFIREILQNAEAITVFYPLAEVEERDREREISRSVYVCCPFCENLYFVLVNRADFSGKEQRHKDIFFCEECNATLLLFWLNPEMVAVHWYKKTIKLEGGIS